jgi:hypothetical protein
MKKDEEGNSFFGFITGYILDYFFSGCFASIIAISAILACFIYIVSRFSGC